MNVFVPESMTNTFSFCTRQGRTAEIATSRVRSSSLTHCIIVRWIVYRARPEPEVDVLQIKCLRERGHRDVGEQGLQHAWLAPTHEVALRRE